MSHQCPLGSVSGHSQPISSSTPARGQRVPLLYGAYRFLSVESPLRIWVLKCPPLLDTTCCSSHFNTRQQCTFTYITCHVHSSRTPLRGVPTARALHSRTSPLNDAALVLTDMKCYNLIYIIKNGLALHRAFDSHRGLIFIPFHRIVQRPTKFACDYRGYQEH